MLVVYGHALQAVDFLDLIDEVSRKGLYAFNCQDVVRSRVAVEDVLTLFNGIAFLKMEVLAFRDEVFDGLDTFFRRLDGLMFLLSLFVASRGFVPGGSMA